MTKLQWTVIGLLTIAVISVFFLLDLTLAGVPFNGESREYPNAESNAGVPKAPLSSLTPPLPTMPNASPPSSITLTTPSVPTVTRTPPALQFLADYLLNRSYPKIVDAKPWTNTSVNVWQYAQDLGGVTLWDYFASKSAQGFEEEWSSLRHGWQDDYGVWQPYRQETIKDRGQNVNSYVIVDRFGTGVVDKMVFIHSSVGSKPSDSNPDLAQWGYLSRLGIMRIEVDDKIAYDVPIETWFSGTAVCLTPELAKLFFWHYSDFGSVGSIVPIPYQNHIKISVYGGIEKPKWFAFTGVTLPKGTLVQPLSGCLDPAVRDAIKSLAPNVTNPETYLERVAQTTEAQSLVLSVTGKNSPSSPIQTGSSPSRLAFPGKGTITAIQFRVPKNYDLASLNLTVRYGKETAIDLPLLAFFSDQDRIVQHRSTPIGVVDDPNDSTSYLLYSNYPLPYQNGIEIELTTRAQPVNIQATYARSAEVTNTQLRVMYDDFRSHPMLQPLGPDYTVTLPGNGKLVGLVLATRDYSFDPRKIPGPPPSVFPGTIVFPMGYIESNVTLKDGSGATRIYNGLEDFADGGYAFDSDKGQGAKNLPFAGVLTFAWKPSEKGYFTIFRYFNDLSAFRFKKGLTLSFQHGTWKNNFPVRYGVTAFYYSEIQ